VAEEQPTCATLLLGARPNREEIEQQQPSSATSHGLAVAWVVSAMVGEWWRMRWWMETSWVASNWRENNMHSKRAHA